MDVRNGPAVALGSHTPPAECTVSGGDASGLPQTGSASDPGSTQPGSPPTAVRCRSSHGGNTSSHRCSRVMFPPVLMSLAVLWTRLTGTHSGVFSLAYSTARTPLTLLTSTHHTPAPGQHGTRPRGTPTATSTDTV